MALPASLADEPASPPTTQQRAEAAITSAVRLLAQGELNAFMSQFCGDCETKSARDRWRRYQLSTAEKNAPYCLHGERPGVVEVVRWQGSLEQDGTAKAYLRCGGGQHKHHQESRLPVPITIVQQDDGSFRITQLSI